MCGESIGLNVSPFSSAPFIQPCTALAASGCITFPMVCIHNNAHVKMMQVYQHNLANLLDLSFFCGFEHLQYCVLL